MNEVESPSQQTPMNSHTENLARLVELILEWEIPDEPMATDATKQVAPVANLEMDAANAGDVPSVNDSVEQSGYEYREEKF